jgi:hypothetical protein
MLGNPIDFARLTAQRRYRIRVSIDWVVRAECKVPARIRYSFPAALATTVEKASLWKSNVTIYIL